MSARHLPVKPDLRQLKHQAKELLRAFQRGDPSAIADFADYHPQRVDAASAQLADAQLVLARTYDAISWPRLVAACELIGAAAHEDFDLLRTPRQSTPRYSATTTGARDGATRWRRRRTVACGASSKRSKPMEREA